MNRILLEKRMGQMMGDTESQTPKLADRADFVTSDYIGISKFGIYNFRTTSQTNEGYYWFQSIEVPDLGSKIIDEDITPDFIKNLIENEDIKVYCDDPSFLYWALKYKANSNNYGIEPETRRPKRNNTRLMGSNCFTGDTEVLTENGLVPIKDIKIGDKVFTHLGRLKEVVANSKREPDKLLKLKIGTEEIKCTEEHPFYILREGKPTWIKAKDLKTRDIALSPKLNLESDTKLPNGFAFMLGLFLSDGNFGIGKKSDGSIYTKRLRIALDKKYKEFYQSKFDSLGLISYYKEIKNSKSGAVFEFSPNESLDLINFIKKYGGFTYKNISNKFLSSDCLSWSLQDKLDLINGFFWGDGQFGQSKDKDGYLTYSIYNTNKDIIQKLYLLIRSFTFARLNRFTRKSFIQNNKQVNPKESFIIKVTGKNILDILNEDSYNIKSVPTKQISKTIPKSIIIDNILYYTSIIYKKEFINIEPVYNMEVEDDHTYLITRNLYVTHNCKHLQSVMQLLKTGQCYEQMAEDTINWAKYQAGESYKNFQKTRINSDKYKKSHRMNYETADSYMNDYFASKAGFNKFLDDEDIKGSLQAEIERTAKTDPNMTLDDFITEEFGVDGVQGLANELQIDIDYVRQYFKDLGF